MLAGGAARSIDPRHPNGSRNRVCVDHGASVAERRSMSIPSLPSELLELVFVNLSLKSLSSARAVSRAWHDVSKSDAVIVAASAITGSLTCTQIRGLLGLHVHDVSTLPCRPFVTLRGRTCWLYGPSAVARGLKLKRTLSCLSPKKQPSREHRSGCKKSRVH